MKIHVNTFSKTNKHELKLKCPRGSRLCIDHRHDTHPVCNF